MKIKIYSKSYSIQSVNEKSVLPLYKGKPNLSNNLTCNCDKIKVSLFTVNDWSNEVLSLI